MEWNQHLTAIQGAFMSLDKIVGPLVKIKYKGGKEEQILKVVRTIEQYLTSKNFIRNKNISIVFALELQNIILFMLLNTEFECNHLLDIEEFSYIRHSTPQLSKCLLANIIIDLDITPHYSKVITKLPIEANLELLNEVITCIKHSQPENAVEHTFVLIAEIIAVLCTLQDQEEVADKLLDVSLEMLKNVSAVNVDWLPDRKLKQINQHMGITLMYFLRLLRKCPVHATNLGKLVDYLIGITVTLMKSVTINIYCFWAEVNYEEQPLQIVISKEAYLVGDHLQKFKPALELVQMLGSIAKKPKTLEEIINEADAFTMICMINKCDNDQRHWFKAFINNNPLQNQESLYCLDKWSHLCNKDDVTVILNFSVSCKKLSIKEIVLKCADNLSVKDLRAVSLRYFVEKNTNNLDIGTTNNQLNKLLNKADAGTVTEDYFLKQIHLMLLQNPKHTVTYLFEKCLDSAIFIPSFRRTFKSIRDIVKINDIGKNAFIEVLYSDLPCFKNHLCYMDLLDELLNMSYFTEITIICDAFIPLLKHLIHDDRTSLLYTLDIFKMINLRCKIEDEICTIVGILADIMEKHRCNALSFVSLQQRIVNECVALLVHYKNTSNAEDFCTLVNKDFIESLNMKNCLNKFHVENLGSTSRNYLVKYLCPTYSFTNIVGVLKMVLASCIEQEWIYIVDELESELGFETTYSLLTNVLIVLCQLTNSHTGDEREHLNSNVKYCLEMYSIVIKVLFKDVHTSLQDEIILTKNICKLLSEIPQDIRSTDGIGLAQLLSIDSLCALKQDKAFILLLVSINDATITQTIARKMIGNT